MRPEEKHCAILVDEMQLTAGLDFDPTVKNPIGLATAPLSNPVPKGELTYATHGLVLMLTGLSSRWKQVVAYHLTGDSNDGSFLRDFLFSVIEKCEAAGCHVDAVISDMGPNNKALCHRVRGQSFFLPAAIVTKYELPTDEVSVKHIRELAVIDAERDLKLASHLKPAHLDPDHFAKMNVASSVAVLNHSVGAATRTLVSLRLLESEALTTAWFVERVFRWFTLMTSRYIGTAMSLFKHDEAVAFLKEFMEIFAHVCIKSGNAKEMFKPVQAGVLITASSALHIQHQLLSVPKFKFVLLCRLSQDALENLFCIRSRHPVPRPLEFKLMLRLIMLSQFF
ncbi:hypothetical protein V5799_023338 [Amblyomma americanum]|uniref:Transposable element P transposase-like RNase H domain-containing protein n=1 Tax=Amblyomma americanum TaxID=6943 RepID=A0AAQ4FI84_AMBAM